jgi:hypothetical protein
MLLSHHAGLNITRYQLVTRRIAQELRFRRRESSGSRSGLRSLVDNGCGTSGVIIAVFLPW